MAINVDSQYQFACQPGIPQLVGSLLALQARVTAALALWMATPGNGESFPSRAEEESTMDIRLKRAYERPEASDGIRMLVDKIWPRGVRKEDAELDEWLKEIAPSSGLRKWFNHDPARWEDFGSNTPVSWTAGGSWCKNLLPWRQKTG
jgi:hypothetical protein